MFETPPNLGCIAALVVVADQVPRPQRQKSREIGILLFNIQRCRIQQTVDFHDLGRPPHRIRQGVPGLLDLTGNGGLQQRIQRLAQAEGMLLDPVYTGKAFAGMLDLVEKGQLGSNGPIIFLHTGGLPALFAFEGESIVD